MANHETVKRIEEAGIVPAIRAESSDDALFAAEAVAGGGIPIVEVTMTIPGAVDVISTLVRRFPQMVVGAGTVLDLETARRCLGAGAHFLTSPGFDRDLAEFAAAQDVAMVPGALTPTEVWVAWKTGCDLVKVFPCAQVGGPKYIRALKRPFPHVPLIASGGVSQHNASDFMLAGATALGIGSGLIPPEAIELRQVDRIHELARRFLDMVRTARAHLHSTS
jgi:2-dehydro-3-deoxyphosphogluconate aldolase / (4S)-4-hydroxy-2-oxoglutarate aldolase